MKRSILAGLLLIIQTTALAVAAHVCHVTIHSDDQIRWDTKDIKVNKECETFTVTLIHDGHLDKGVMGHNWVLTKTEDRDDVAKSLIANKESDYISDDPRILAHTKLLGGGQVSTVTFTVNQLQEKQQYSFFCSYPEHIELMNGTLELVE